MFCRAMFKGVSWQERDLSNYHLPGLSQLPAQIYHAIGRLAVLGQGLDSIGFLLNGRHAKYTQPVTKSSRKEADAGAHYQVLSGISVIQAATCMSSQIFQLRL